VATSQRADERITRSEGRPSGRNAWWYHLLAAIGCGLGMGNGLLVAARRSLAPMHEHRDLLALALAAKYAALC
jgi:hypothetical protein